MKLATTMRTSINHPLRIAEIPVPRSRGIIGVSLCPGKKQLQSSFGTHWHRDLDVDLDRIQRWGATLILTLVELEELVELEVPHLGAAVTHRGMAWHHLPLPDRTAPTEDWNAQWIQCVRDKLHQRLAAGQKILIHCKGGLGRAGTVAARLLMEHGLVADAAMERVRLHRKGAIETMEQEIYLQDGEAVFCKS